MTTRVLQIDRDELLARLQTVLAKDTTGVDPRAKINKTFVLIGPPGTGKTSAIDDLASMNDLLAAYNEAAGLDLPKIPVYPVACHQDMVASEITGMYLPLDNEWNFIPGPMLRAWGFRWHLDHVADLRTGVDTECKTPPPGILNFNDLHLIGMGGQSALYTAFDAGQGGSYLDPWGNRIYPHPAHFACGTTNGEVDTLDQAVRDRIAMSLPVMQPSTVMIEALDEELQDACAVDYSSNTMTPRATYREWKSISDLRPIVGLRDAVIMALGTEERAKKLIETLSHGIEEANDIYKQLIAAAK